MNRQASKLVKRRGFTAFGGCGFEVVDGYLFSGDRYFLRDMLFFLLIIPARGIAHSRRFALLWRSACTGRSEELGRGEDDDGGARTPPSDCAQAALPRRVRAGGEAAVQA